MKCDRCQNVAAYSRKYSGENLCSICFSDSILRKTAKTISKFNMIKNNELVCVAVSGGKDSLALLHILHQMSKNHNFRIKVITIDEGIPDYRNEALEIVKSFCEKINVEHSVYSYKRTSHRTPGSAGKAPRGPPGRRRPPCGTLRRR